MVPSGVNRQRPNVSAVQTFVHRSPIIPVIGGPEHATAKVRSCKNIAVCIDRQCPNIRLDHAMINFNPVISVVSRKIDATRAVNKISSQENVAIVVDG